MGNSEKTADWSGKGVLACYGHFETDATFDEGASNGGDASVTCRPAEWGGVLSPEAMFFTEESSGNEFQIWAWDYHEPNIPYATCNVLCGTRKTIWVLEFVLQISMLK